MQYYLVVPDRTETAGSTRTGTSMLQYLAQFGRSVVAHIWIWVGVPITIWNAEREFAENTGNSPCLELQINRINIGSLPCGCELVAYITIRNRGSDSQATEWQLCGKGDKGISLISNEAVQVRFEPMGGDLADHPIRRSQTRRGVITFIVQGISEAQARQLTCLFLVCRDGLNVRHESAALYL